MPAAPTLNTLERWRECLGASIGRGIGAVESCRLVGASSFATESGHSSYNFFTGGDEDSICSGAAAHPGSPAVGDGSTGSIYSSSCCLCTGGDGSEGVGEGGPEGGGVETPGQGSSSGRGSQTGSCCCHCYCRSCSSSRESSSGGVGGSRRLGGSKNTSSNGGGGRKERGGQRAGTPSLQRASCAALTPASTSVSVWAMLLCIAASSGALAQGALPAGLEPDMAHFDANRSDSVLPPAGRLYIWKDAEYNTRPSNMLVFNGNCSVRQYGTCGGAVDLDGSTCCGSMLNDLKQYNGWDDSPVTGFTVVWLGRFASGSAAGGVSGNGWMVGLGLYGTSVVDGGLLVSAGGVALGTAAAAEGRYGISESWSATDGSGTTTAARPPFGEWTMEVLVRAPGAATAAYHRCSQSACLTASLRIASFPAGVTGRPLVVGGACGLEPYPPKDTLLKGQVAILLLYGRALAVREVKNLADYYRPRFGLASSPQLPPETPTSSVSQPFAPSLSSLPPPPPAAPPPSPPPPPPLSPPPPPLTASPPPRAPPPAPPPPPPVPLWPSSRHPTLSPPLLPPAPPMPLPPSPPRPLPPLLLLLPSPVPFPPPPPPPTPPLPPPPPPSFPFPPLQQLQQLPPSPQPSPQSPSPQQPPPPHSPPPLPTQQQQSRPPPPQTLPPPSPRPPLPSPSHTHTQPTSAVPEPLRDNPSSAPPPPTATPSLPPAALPPSAPITPANPPPLAPPPPPPLSPVPPRTVATARPPPPPPPAAPLLRVPKSLTDSIDAAAVLWATWRLTASDPTWPAEGSADAGGGGTSRSALVASRFPGASQVEVLSLQLLTPAVALPGQVSCSDSLTGDLRTRLAGGMAQLLQRLKKTVDGSSTSASSNSSSSSNSTSSSAVMVEILCSAAPASPVAAAGKAISMSFATGADNERPSGEEGPGGARHRLRSLTEEQRQQQVRGDSPTSAGAAVCAVPYWAVNLTLVNGPRSAATAAGGGGVAEADSGELAAIVYDSLTAWAESSSAEPLRAACVPMPVSYSVVAQVQVTYRAALSEAGRQVYATACGAGSLGSETRSEAEGLVVRLGLDGADACGVETISDIAPVAPPGGTSNGPAMQAAAGARNTDSSSGGGGGGRSSETVKMGAFAGGGAAAAVVVLLALVALAVVLVRRRRRWERHWNDPRVADMASNNIAINGRGAVSGDGGGSGPGPSWQERFDSPWDQSSTPSSSKSPSSPASPVGFRSLAAASAAVTPAGGTSSLPSPPLPPPWSRAGLPPRAAAYQTLPHVLSHVSSRQALLMARQPSSGRNHKQQHKALDGRSGAGAWEELSPLPLPLPLPLPAASAAAVAADAGGAAAAGAAQQGATSPSPLQAQPLGQGPGRAGSSRQWRYAAEVVRDGGKQMAAAATKGDGASTTAAEHSPIGKGHVIATAAAGESLPPPPPPAATAEPATAVQATGQWIQSQARAVGSARLQLGSR